MDMRYARAYMQERLDAAEQRRLRNEARRFRGARGVTGPWRSGLLAGLKAISVRPPRAAEAVAEHPAGCVC